jgi:DNA-binding CsgD family transcriptional regulator
MQGRQLAVACPADRAALQSAVAAAIDRADVTAVKMHDRKGATLAFCRVLPLPVDDERGHRLALIVSRSAQVAPEQIRVVCEISGLSQAECRVAELLAGGANPQEIAKALGCSIHTVRAHLKQIFYKTNTARQVEFIALVRTAVP